MTITLSRTCIQKPVWILTIVVLFSLVGCAFENPKESQKDPLNEASALADRGDYQKASEILEDFVKHYPDDNKAWMLLSNVYAAQAGISFQRLVPLLQHFLDDSKGASRRAEKRPIVRLLQSTESNASISAANALVTYENTLDSVDSVLEIFEKVPDMTVEQHVAFKKSLAAAFKAKQPSKGDALYRAILLAIELKYSWFIEGNMKFMDSDCTLNSQRLNQFILITRGSIKGIFGQLVIGYPKLSPKLNEELARFEASIPDLKEQLKFVQFPKKPSTGSFRNLWECI